MCMEISDRCDPTCDAVNPYITLARSKGITLDQSDCVSCNGRTGEYVMPNQVSVDLVFIVSESAEMLEGTRPQDLKGNLSQVAENMDNRLSKCGYTDNRFAVVAYGGSDPLHCKPHLHTDGEEMFASRSLQHVINSLDFCNSDDCGCSPRKGDPMRAIEFATSLKFRDNAVKIFIAIDNTERETDAGYLDINYIQQIMSERGIIFNAMSTYKEFSKGITKVPVVGITSSGKPIYNKKSSAEKFTETIDIPKGQLAKLATASNGNIFGINFLKSGSDDLKSKMAKTACDLAEDFVRNDPPQNCRCQIDIYGRPNSICGFF